MDAAVQKAKSQADRNELLIWAASRGLLADAVELLAQGAEPGTRDKRGLTPAHYAAAHGHLDVLQYLGAKGVDLDAEDERARAPLHYAAAGSSAEVLRFLVSKSAWLDGNDADDDTPLHLAARRGWLLGVSLLLGGGAKTTPRNKRGLTPLGEAAAGGHFDAAKALIAAGADVRCGAGSGYSLLHVAAGLGHARVLKLLLDSGLAPDGGGGNGGGDGDAPADGATPLHAAAMGGSAECAEALVAKGADPLAPSADGRLPHECVEAGAPLAAETLRKLLERAADKARKAGGAKPAAPAPASAPTKPAGAAVSAGDEGGGGEEKEEEGPEAYARVFERLSPQERERRVDGLARMAEGEVAGLDFLTDGARQAVAQVRRALQLLSCFRAVAALHRDERFQEDAGDPRVQAAIEEIRGTGSVDKYARDGQVVSVMGKLRKLQGVLRDAGGMRVGLEELLPAPGRPLEEMVADDARRIAELEAAHAAARAAAVAAVLGRPLSAPTSAGGCEIEPADGGAAAAGAGAGGGGGSGRPDGDDEEEDEFADVVKARAGGRGGGGKGGAAAAGKRVVVAKAGTPVEDEPPGAPGEPLWKRQLRQAAKDTLNRIVRITLLFVFITGLMWLLDMLPSQQGAPGAAMEARMVERLRQMRAAAEAARQQAEGAGGAAAAAAAAAAGAAAPPHGGEL